EYDLLAGFHGDQAYLNTSLRVGDAAGLGPLTADVVLVRGVWLQGRVSDAATGRPIPRARVRYGAAKANPNLAPFAFDGNPAFRDNRDSRGLPLLEQGHTITNDDGK